MSPEKQVETIGFILDTFTRNRNDENGDKYLSDSEYTLEAIDAVIGGYDSPILRQFLGT